MKNILLSTLLPFLALIPCSQVNAESGLGIEFEARAGHNYATWNQGKNKFQTNEVRVAAHKQLGDLPLSLGLSTGEVNMVALPDGTGRAEGYDLALEAKAWLPSEITGSDSFNTKAS